MLDSVFATDSITIKKVSRNKSGDVVEAADVVVDGVSIQLESAYGTIGGDAENRTIYKDVIGFIFVGSDVDIKPTDHIWLPEGYFPRKVTATSVGLLRNKFGDISHKEVGFK